MNEDSKLEPWRSDGEHATSRPRSLTTIFIIYEWVGKKHFVSLKLEGQSGVRTHDLRISNPVNTRHWSNVGLILDHRLRRWPNINPILLQCLVFTGKQAALATAPAHLPSAAMSKRNAPSSHHDTLLNGGLMLVNRLLRWPNVALISRQCGMFNGINVQCSFPTIGFLHIINHFLCAPLHVAHKDPTYNNQHVFIVICLASRDLHPAYSCQSMNIYAIYFFALVSPTASFLCFI